MCERLQESSLCVISPLRREDESEAFKECGSRLDRFKFKRTGQKRPSSSPPNDFPSQPTHRNKRESRKAFLCYCFYKCLKVIDNIHILIMACADNEVSRHRNIHCLSMPGILSLTFEQKHCNSTQYLYILETSKHSQMLEPWLLKSHGLAGIS